MFDIGKFDSTVHVVVFVYCVGKGTATDEIVPIGRVYIKIGSIKVAGKLFEVGIDSFDGVK
eukprot:2060663-Prymnesium_polylepis.1